MKVRQHYAVKEILKFEETCLIRDIGKAKVCPTPKPHLGGNQ